MSVTDIEGSIEGIEGKVVAITGASSGIGEATALRLARGGARLVLGARREERLAELAAKIAAEGGEVAYTATDVTRREDLEALVAQARERFGRLDVLVSNAGIGPISPFDALEVDDWDATIDVNLRGVLYGIAAALPVFREQEAGHFVHTASTAGLKVVPTMGVYGAVKNAVRTVSETLRQEAGEHLRVTVVSPGAVDTEFTQSINHPDSRAAVEDRLGAIAIPPDAVARAIAYAIEQPPDIDVNTVVVQATAQA